MSTRGPIDPLLRAASVAHSSVDVEALYVEHRARLLGVAAAITLDRALAEEIVQDAFAGLQHHANRVDNPVGYLRRSVVNISVNVIRRRRVAAGHPAVPALGASTAEIDETWTSVARDLVKLDPTAAKAESTPTTGVTTTTLNS
jgi:DNA-directed RNA polymerase specialized sigma24 family protein